MKRYYKLKSGKIIDTQAKNVTSVEVVDKETAEKEYGWDCGFICIYYCDDTGEHCETDDKGGKSMDNFDLPNIVKEADTIEELCDLFIKKSKEIGNDYYKIGKDAFTIFDKKFCKEDYEHYDYFGAIWTEKGLIYVVKYENGERRVI